MLIQYTKTINYEISEILSQINNSNKTGKLHSMGLAPFEDWGQEEAGLDQRKASEIGSV